MGEQTPLETEIRRRITVAGPMPVSEYMALCLSDAKHGYYITRDPLGARGDFVTAPEISQMFGELIGLWMAAVWKQMGEPAKINVVELGPGRGTMMKDALRATRVMPNFRKAVMLHMVEICPPLRAQQSANLRELPVPMAWHTALNDVPTGAAIIIANEFFDALPVNQVVKTERGWHERRIAINAADQLAFTLAPDPLPHFESLLPQAVRDAKKGTIYEWRPDTMAMEIGRRVARDGGAALVIDYGHGESAAGETLQAVGQHDYADPLSTPGEIDITAHVDFRALIRALESMGAECFGPLTQAQFLRSLGIEERAAALKNKADNPDEVDAALLRLTAPGRAGMGRLFKVAAGVHSSLGIPPGFET
jgi:NADH dehydrogenase [ubiquinone] 1 alpha subcomplex assembly factor 7